MQAYNNLANGLKSQGWLDDAIEQYRLALRIAPNYAEGHYNLGLALSDSHKHDEAIACYREALRLRPEFVEAQFNLGCLFKSQGLLPEALANLEQVVAARPDFADAQAKLGLTLKALGRPEAAATLSRCDAQTDADRSATGIGRPAACPRQPDRRDRLLPGDRPA